MESIDSRGRRPAATLIFLLVCSLGLAALLAPALWNHYPLLQYDTGGYLARWYEGYLVPSRSTVFGLYLHLGEGLHFWPVVVAQSLLTLWIVSLTLRAHYVTQSRRTYVAILAALCVATTLPFLTSVLLTDIFVGLGVLALHLLMFRRKEQRRVEVVGLVTVIAFASASHSATMVTLMAILAGGIAARFLIPSTTSTRNLFTGGYAIAIGAAMLLAANFALSGRAQWTPGGYGIVFGRMLQDGIVARYLNDHCPDEKLKLCPYRHDLPATADDFLWSDSVFNRLGRFTGLGDEMRTIVLGSLAAYPLEQVRTAAAATMQQLGMVSTGAGVHNQVWHTYGIIERYTPTEAAAMRAARQQRGEFDFSQINRLHVPVALASMALLLVTLLRFRRRRDDDLALLATSVTIALLSNAFVCGALSGPHERYGARISWIMTLVVAIAALRLLAGARVSPVARHTAVAPVP